MTAEQIHESSPHPDLEAVCVCGTARYQHGGRTGAGRCLDCGCARFRWDPADRAARRAAAAADDEPSVALRRYARRSQRRRTAGKERAGGSWSVGPSDHSACHRAIGYRENPPPDYEPIPIPKDEADVGTMLHNEFTRARRLTYPWRRFNVTVTVPGLDRPGRADEVDDLIGRVTDYKTAGDWKWEQVGKNGPPDADWKQVHDYALGLAEDGFRPQDLEIIYINREHGRAERFVRPYSRLYALAAVTELHDILDALDEGRELPRLRAGDELLGPTVNSLCARYCPAVNHCWGLDTVPADRTPEGWLLARDDEGVASALVTYAAARDQESEVEKVKKYARTLLTGVEPGRYGNMTLGWSGGNLGDPKPDRAARLAQLEAAMRMARDTGEVPPDPDELEYPQIRLRSNVTIAVKPVRAARLESEKER